MELDNKTKQMAGYFPTLRHFDLSSCKSGKALVYFILSSFEALFLRSQKKTGRKKNPFTSLSVTAGILHSLWNCMAKTVNGKHNVLLRNALNV